MHHRHGHPRCKQECQPEPRNASRRSHRRRRRSRPGRCGGRGVPGHPVRGAPGRRAALAAAAARRALARHPRGHRLRLALPAAVGCVRPGQHVRGLPVPERVRPRGSTRKAPARDGLGARRLAAHRRERRLQPGRTGPGRRGRGHHQLPARCPRLPGRRGAGQPPRWPGRQLRPDGPAGRAALGAAQHRRLRRQPGRRDPVRRIGGRPVHAGPAGLAGCARAVPAGHRGERDVPADPAVARRGRSGRAGLRRQGRLRQYYGGRQQHGGLPAPPSRLDDPRPSRAR